MIDVQSRVDGFGFYGVLPPRVYATPSRPKLIREGLLADRREGAALYKTSYAAALSDSPKDV